ncbi:MAG TPA: lipopolysaccharide biosynthesis protein [Steroidobacteraceae bacterium]|jgi:O-antigen/teichoic acid export membrane protein
MSDEHLKLRALSGVRWTVSARALVQLITWPVTILVMRLLHPHDYGLVAMSAIVINFVALFGEPGLAAGLVQTQVLREDTTRAAGGLIVLLNLVLLAALMLAAPWIASWFHEPQLTLVIRVASLSLLSTAIATIPQALLQRNLRFRELALALIAGNLAGSLVTVTLAFLDFGVWALIIGSLVISFVTSAVMICYEHGVIWPDFSQGLTPVRHLVHFSAHVVGSRILWYWSFSLDTIILGRMVTSSAVGSYSVGSSLAAIPGDKAMDALNRVSFPTLSRMRGDPARFNSTAERLLGLLALFGFSIAWGIAAVAPEFVHVVLSDKWRLAVVPLAMVSIAAPIRMLWAFQNTVSVAVGAPAANTKVLTLSGILLPIGVLAGARIDGINGAAISLVVVYPIVFLVSTFLTCRATGGAIRDSLSQLVVPFAGGIAMLLAVAGARALLSTRLPSIALLGTEILIGAAAFLGAVRLIRPAVLDDARALVRDLLRPGAQAAAGLSKS